MKWYLDFGHGGKDSGAVGSNGKKESEDYIEDIATTIASTLLSFVGKELIPSSKDIYRVCIGAFNDRDNAVSMKSEAISKGFKDAYII